MSATLMIALFATMIGTAFLSGIFGSVIISYLPHHSLGNDLSDLPGIFVLRIMVQEEKSKRDNIADKEKRSMTMIFLN